MDKSATAFVGRQASFLFNLEASWEDPEDDDRNLAWARSFVEVMVEYSDGSRYLSFPGLDEEGGLSHPSYLWLKARTARRAEEQV